MHPIRTLFLISAALCAIAAPSAAQSLEASVSRERVYVGDQILYNIVLTDARSDDLPSITFPPSVRAEFAGTSRNSYTTIQRVQGQPQRVTINSITHQYRLTALSPGTVRIPEANLTLGPNRSLTSNAVRFDALLPEPALDASLIIQAPRTTVFVGESLRVSVTWTMPEVARGAGFDTSEIPATLTVSPIEIPTTRSGRVVEFEFRGQRSLGIVEQVFTPSGDRVNRFRFDLLITPTEPGPVTLGPFRVVFDRPRSVDGFVRAYAESEPLRLTVRPIPLDTQPDNYTGLIGDYTLRAMANPTTANVGDPLTLRVELIGDEPITTPNPLPDLRGQPAFENLFRLSTEGWTEQTPRQPGKRIYTTTVRALTDQATQIPPIAISTFDPEQGEYDQVRSDPIQLDIRAVYEATIADAIVTPTLRPAPEARVLRPTDPGFWAPPTIAQILNADGFNLARQATRPAFLALLASGPVALSAALVCSVAARRRAHPKSILARRLREAEHLAVRRSPADAARHAVSVTLDCDPDAVTLADLDRLPTHPGIRRVLSDALTPLEHPHTSTIEPVTPADMRLAIRTLRRELTRSLHAPTEAAQ